MQICSSYCFWHLVLLAKPNFWKWWRSWWLNLVWKCTLYQCIMSIWNHAFIDDAWNLRTELNALGYSASEADFAYKDLLGRLFEILAIDHWLQVPYFKLGRSLTSLNPFYSVAHCVFTEVLRAWFSYSELCFMNSY
jgi:hypothetical protein